MNSSIHIGTFSGIPLKIHWTFSFLILFLLFTILTEGVGLEQSLWFGGYIVALFLCVVLHEYGHAIAAKRYGVKTKDIILSPIGGVARLEVLPEKPVQELIIALAGPAVNVLIAVLLTLGFLFSSVDPLEALNYDILSIEGPKDFFVFLLVLNVMLFVFNLIPAFPMDGGRVLRSLLAMKFGRVSATRVASYVGRILAIGFVVFGLANSMYVLAFIGVFIYMSATAEYRYTKLSSVFSEHIVSDIMRTDFTKLHIGDTYSKPIDLYRRNIESNFLVFDSLGYLVGTVPELFIKEVMHEEFGEDIKVGNKMSSHIGKAAFTSSLKDVFELMNTQGIAIVAIVENDEIIGVVDRTAMSRLL